MSIKRRGRTLRKTMALVAVSALTLTFGANNAVAADEEVLTNSVFDISIQGGEGSDVQQPDDPDDPESPVRIKLANPLSSGTQHWSFTVKAKSDIRSMFHVTFSDPDPDMRVKSKPGPTPSTGGGQGQIQYYPDLFTQLRFTISDGGSQVWTGKLGTVGQFDPSNPDTSAPRTPGYLAMDLPLQIGQGDAKEYDVSVTMDSGLGPEELTAYNGTTTKLGFKVDGIMA